MKTFTKEDIKNWNPCHEPAPKFPADFPLQGATALDFLNWHGIEYVDRIWLVLHSKTLTDFQMKSFAIWGARQILDKFLGTEAFEAMVCLADYADSLQLGMDCKPGLLEARRRAIEVRSEIKDPELRELTKAVLSVSWESGAGAMWAVATIAGPLIGTDAVLAKLAELISSDDST